jgi:CRP/FNR family transcriptional regulator
LDKYGEKNAEGPTKFELPLSRHDLAAMIGTTPESMSRTIKKMESDGVAKFTGRTVLIPEIESLVMEFEPETFI